MEQNPKHGICPCSSKTCNDYDGHHTDNNQGNAIASKLRYGGQSIQKSMTESRDQIHQPWNEAEIKDIEGVTSESKDSNSGGFCRGSKKVGIMPPSKTDDTTVASKSSSPNPSGGKDVVGQVSGVVSSFVGRKHGKDHEQLSFQQAEPMTELQKQEAMAVTPKPDLQIQGPIE